MKPDRFDIIGIAAAAVFAAGAAFYGLTDGSQATAIVARTGAATRADQDVIPKMTAARALMDAGQVKEAARTLEEICTAAPAAAEAHALLGQACSRLQDYPGAVMEFRMCLSLDADYADGKSPKFIGKRIKSTLKECRPRFEAALSGNPADKEAFSAMQDVHYLERMLAGGCE